MASVMTVCGPVSADSLGIILSHEHLFIDLRNQFSEFGDPKKRRISHQKLRMGNLGVVRRNPYAIKDNLLLDDLEMIVSEVGAFAALGGKTLVDCTSVGIHRDPEKLHEVARRTGLHIIAGCGYYTHDTHPAEMDEWSAESIADDIVSDLTVGINGTGIKAGVIGEIGTSEPIHPNERKCLLAAALAFRQRSVAIYVHIYPWGKAGLEATDLLVAQGVNPDKIVVCHSDVEPDPEYIRALLKRGVFVEFDNFGKEFYIDPADRGFADGVFVRDVDRVRMIKKILDWGYETQILVTNDICLKCMLRHYGGWGYDHILRNVVPMMEDEGVPREAIDRILRDNPKRVLGNSDDCQN